MTLGHTVTAGRLILTVRQLSRRGHGQTSGALIHEMEDLYPSTKRRVPYIHAVTCLLKISILCVYFSELMTARGEYRKRGVSFQGDSVRKKLKVIARSCERSRL
jgi:hypothetical protein